MEKSEQSLIFKCWQSLELLQVLVQDKVELYKKMKYEFKIYKNTLYTIPWSHKPNGIKSWTLFFEVEDVAFEL